MLELFSIYYQYKRGKENGSIHALIAIVLFLIFFKPFVWIIKITGIFDLLQWMGIINEQGTFSFFATIGYMLLFVIIMGILGVLFTLFTSISDLLNKNANKKQKNNLKFY